MTGTPKNDDLMGYWMIKPDGTPATAWHRYRQLIMTSEPSCATADAVKSPFTLLYHDAFNIPGEDIGPAWAHTSHYGPVVVKAGNGRVQLSLPQAEQMPWGSGTLDLTAASVLGRGLNPGEYFEFTMRREQDNGSIGVELFDSDQLRQGGGHAAGPSPLIAWTGASREGWVPFSIDDTGKSIAFDWNLSHVLGVRFDSADGNFATFTYYVDGRYAGSMLLHVGNRTLDKIGFYCQSDSNGATFDFSDLKVYGRRNAN